MSQSNAHDHGHDHDHDHTPTVTSANERKVLVSFFLIFGFMLVEAVGGVLSGSLALLADAGHMLTDAVALALAYAAFRFGRRAADSKRTFGYLRFEVIATPGHTTGSISLMAEIDGVHVAFTGDLIAGPGKVWSLSATQWTYNGAEGVAYSVSSLTDLREREPERLLPSHGAPVGA